MNGVIHVVSASAVQYLFKGNSKEFKIRNLTVFCLVCLIAGSDSADVASALC
jgi:hypothetical protein